MTNWNLDSKPPNSRQTAASFHFRLPPHSLFPPPLPTHQLLHDLEDVFLSCLHLVLVTCDGDVVLVRPVLVRQLDPHVVIVPDLVDGGPLLADDVRVVLGVHLERHAETLQRLKEGEGREGDLVH